MSTTFRNIDPQGDLDHPVLGLVPALGLVEVADPALAALMADQPSVWGWESGAEPAPVIIEEVAPTIPEGE